jgi:adenylate kinase family enzyme
MTGAEALLSALWGVDENEGVVHQITRIKNGDVKNIPVRSKQDAISKAQKLNQDGWDVYHACATYNTHENRKVSNAIGAKGFWLDIDCGAEKASSKKGYATKSDANTALIDFIRKTKLPHPTHVVDSGNGIHAYFVTDRLIAKGAWINSSNQLKALCKHHGFLADDSRTSDLASILRLPDTRNLKDINNPKPVTLKGKRDALHTDNLTKAIESAFMEISALKISESKMPEMLSTFPVEQLGVKKTVEVFHDTTENRKKLLSAAKAAFPEGLPDRPTFMELGLSLSSLVVTHKWPVLVAREILDDIASKPVDANRENNDIEWANYIKGTSERYERGETVKGIGSIFEKAVANGWTWQSTDIQPINIPDFALIQLGSKVGIIDVSQAARANTKMPLSIYSREDGKLLIKRSITEQNPNINADKVVNQWLLSPNTLVFKGVELNTAKTTSGYLNLWHGLSINPKMGDYRRIETFIKDIVCSSSTTHFEYLWNWLAHMIQKPWEKPGVSITLLGGQGVGKGTFAAKIVGAMYLDHFLHLQSDKALTGDFNDSLESSFVIFADEAFFSGDRKAANILKAIETEDRIHINPKFQPSRQIESFHRIISASNNDHASYVETDDRRKLILRLPDTKRDDWVYWRELDEELKSGGLEALAFALSQTDISSFEVRKKPDTGELLRQKLASLDSIPQWWADRLMMGSQISATSEWKDWCSTASLYDDFLNCHKSNHSRSRTPSIREFVDKLKEFCAGISPSQQGASNSRKRGFTFPSLDYARKHFEQKLGGEITWQ